MKGKEDTKIPEFRSLEEEREYWEARGPLAEGHKGRIKKPQPHQKRSSFLSVRLSGEELTLLRDMAAKVGLGPSTYARLAIISAIQEQILTSAEKRRFDTEIHNFLRRRSLMQPLYVSSVEELHKSKFWPSDERAEKAYERAEKAYAAYMEAVKEIEKTYNEFRAK